MEFLSWKLTDPHLSLYQKSDVIILAVKPQVLSNVFEQLKNTHFDGQLFMSVITGVRLEALRNGIQGTSANLTLTLTLSFHSHPLSVSDLLFTPTPTLHPGV